MIREFLKRIRIAVPAAGTPPGRPAQRLAQGLARELLKLQIGGPPGASDQALGVLLLRDPPRQGRPVPPSPDDDAGRESRQRPHIAEVVEIRCPKPAVCTCRKSQT